MEEKGYYSIDVLHLLRPMESVCSVKKKKITHSKKGKLKVFLRLVFQKSYLLIIIYVPKS